MATADELLSLTAEEETPNKIITVSLESRIISIPASIHILGVESDDDVRRLQFSVPRKYGEFDLSTFDIRVNFKSASGKGDLYLVDDLETPDDDTMTFSWLVDRVAFDRKGDVKFSICMKKFDDAGNVVKEFNTTVASLPVLEGLETDKAALTNGTTALDTVLFRLYAVEAASGLGKDGYYSIVKVGDEEDGAVFTVINQDGITEAVIKHGYSPVKGIDYWTEEDQIAMQTEANVHAKAYVDAWAPKTAVVTLTAAGWINNQQSASIDGVTEDNIVIIAPYPESQDTDAYSGCRIRGVSQSNDTIIFACDTAPIDDVRVNVAIYYSNSVFSKAGFTVSDDDDGNVVIG